MKAVRSPPCAQCVFCVRAHRLREAIGRHVRRGRTCRYGGFASGGAAAAWRDIAARSSPACHCAANISRNSGKDARKPAFRGLSAAVGVRIFFGRAEARRIFPPRRAGRGKCVAGVFGACGGGVPVARFPFSGYGLALPRRGQVGGFCARFLGRFPRNGDRTGKIIREV